ncbi:MAG: hypothetical protein BIFFINMI_00156 [Phycisphaerae bacterium]|nr:hypothetical protein [Phycisphaerae bacterium]
MRLARLEKLSDAQRCQFLRSLVPQAEWDQVGRLGDRAGPGVEDLQVILRPERGELKLRVPAKRIGGDYAFLLDLDEHGLGEVELAFIQINDLERPRYNIDVDERGRPTLLGTARRNIPEEVRAMEAGLGPGQVRHGLRAFDDFFERLLRFADTVGYVNILLEPLTYHNALMYERHGFIYIQGQKVMEEIDEGFRPGGHYERRLDGSTPFRRPGSGGDQRMRSWAIHDGILGHPMPELKMVYVLGQPTPRVSTFTQTQPDAATAGGAGGSEP